MHNAVRRGAKHQPRTRGSHRRWLEQHVQLSRGALAPRRGGGCHPQRRMAGIGDRDMVVNNHARGPSPLLHRTDDHLRHDHPSTAELAATTARRSLERQHRTHTAFPSSRGTCPTPPGNLAGQARSHDGRSLRRPRTLLWSRGPMKKLILVLAACARQGGEHGRKPRGSAWREPTPGHMCSCARS
jgi:hypothetical protein